MKHWKEPSVSLSLLDAEIADIHINHAYSFREYGFDYEEEYTTIARFRSKDDSDIFSVEYTSAIDYPIDDSKFVLTILTNKDKFEKMKLEQFQFFFEELQESIEPDAVEFCNYISAI